jgi:hypothetical protein
MAVKKKKRNAKTSKGKQALKTTGRAIKKAASSVLGAGSQILSAGSKALNPHRRIKLRNRYIDLVIKGQAKKTPQGWKVGRKTFAQGRGTVNVSSGYYLDKSTGFVYAKRERNKTRRRNIEMGFYDEHGFHPIRASSDYSEGQRPSRSKKARTRKAKAKSTASHRRTVKARKKTTSRLAGRSLSRSVPLKRKRKNISEGFYDPSGVFHPIRSATDYDRATAGETNRKARRTKSKKRIAAKRKASATARHRSVVKARKATTTRLASRSLKKSVPLKKARGRKNPSAESIRKEFAGRVGPKRDVFLPASAPSGKFAKLGKLVSITTEQGTIKPVHGSAVLLADTNGKLHIGSLSGAPLFDGPARSFGKVKKIEYDESKPHLGYPGPIIWFHRMGEETGQRPTLHADGKGGLVFRGGAYRLTSRGIEN